MKHIQWIAAAGITLLAAQAHAAPTPDDSTFTLYGKAPKGTDVTALWEGEVMAESESENGSFELDVPMGSYMPYHPGDKIEIDINNKPLRMVTIGKAGTARRMSLHK